MEEKEIEISTSTTVQHHLNWVFCINLHDLLSSYHCFCCCCCCFRFLFMRVSHALLSLASLFIFICLYFKSIWHGCCVLKTWNGNQNECALWMNELICDSRNCSTKLSYQISFDEIWIEWNSGTRPERSDPMPRKKVVAQMKWFVENDWFNRMFLCVLPSQVIWDSRSKAIYGSTQHTSSHFKENSKSKFNKNK